eukprot:12238748-Ditylum_brightwellii.AAC.1
MAAWCKENSPPSGAPWTIKCNTEVVSGFHLLCIPASASIFFLLGHLGSEVCSVEAVGAGAPHWFGMAIVGAPVI